MNRLAAFDGTLWLADGERFNRCVQAALHKPCPTAAQVRERHREWMTLAKELPTVQGTGIDLPFDAADIDSQYIRTQAITGEPCAEAPRAIRAVKGKIAVVPIFGPLDQRMSAEMEKAGGTPLDFVAAALDSLMSNPAVGAVVLQIDSPGGAISGVQELAEKIHAAEKPVYAIADSMAASAALWLASAATMFISTPGGNAPTVGSHGVYILHLDESAALEKEGVKITMVSAGKHKVEFASHSPLSEESRAHAQERVDGIYGEFTAALAKFRRKSPADVRDNFGQGRMLTAQQALSVGMIDRVLTMPQLLAKLTGAGAKASGPSAEKLLALHEYEEAV